MPVWCTISLAWRNPKTIIAQPPGPPDGLHDFRSQLRIHPKPAKTSGSLMRFVFKIVVWLIKLLLRVIRPK